MSKKRIIVGITGASGAIYGIRTLEILHRMDGIETHLVISAAARRTIVEETSWKLKDVNALAHTVYDDRDIGAAVASGSFIVSGMLIAPCSIGTVSAVANSSADTLIARAADVCLKDRRTLVLMVRETPLHLGHLELMSAVARFGGIIAPPVPAFYNHPESVDDIIDHSVGRCLDLLTIEHDVVRRWH